VQNQAVAENDDLFFAEEESLDESSDTQQKGWKILLVDDESSVHDVTRMTLDGFEYAGRGLDFLHAYSGEEAKQVMAEHPDTALILLDVVMEEDHAGLKVVEHVRNVLKNPFTRIILRTGQPGQAPETEVIVKYDIDDYKEKTELTSQKLYTTMVTTLRGYRATIQLEKSRKGLHKIVDASASVFKIKSMENFVQGVLTQIAALAGLDDDAFCSVGSTLVSHYERKKGSFDQVCRILAGTGQFENMSGQLLAEVLDAETLDKIRVAREEKKSQFYEHDCVVYFEASQGDNGVLYLKGKQSFDSTERDLIELFGHNLSIAYDNIDLNNDLQHTQEDVIHLLGTVSEFHSQETSYHVKRVGQYVARLAQLHGMKDKEIETLEQAAPLHDMGKVGISDAILNKPGRLTEEEMSIMKTHADIGYKILKKNTSRVVLKSASVIAREHHEKWDGTGYPRGLSGEQIHIYGRMSAIADVFDALASRRCYKDAWDMSQVYTLFESERGKHFDPALTDLLLANFDDFTAIFDQLSD
jgi:response regulator RpfG family c-di-GMP phosphodiesterase